MRQTVISTEHYSDNDVSYIPSVVSQLRPPMNILLYMGEAEIAISIGKLEQDCDNKRKGKTLRRLR